MLAADFKMLIYDYTHLTLSWFEWPLEQLWNQKGKGKGQGCCYGNHVGFCGTSYFWLRHFDWSSLSMSIQWRICKEICGEEKKIKAREDNRMFLPFITFVFSIIPLLFLDYNECIYFMMVTETYVIQKEMSLLLLDDFPSEHIRGSGHLQRSSVIVLSCLVGKSYRREQTVKTMPAIFFLFFFFFWWAR